MMRSLKLRKGSYRTVPGKYYGSPKEVWGFRTDPDRRAPRKIAEDFLKENHKLFKLEKNLDTLHFRKTIRSLGAHHVIFQQRWRKLWIHRAYVTVHLGNEGSVYMAKNRAMPKKLLDKSKDVRFCVDVSAARVRAIKAIRDEERSLPKRRTERRRRMEKRLFPLKKKILPAYRFRFYLKNPREERIIYIKASDREPRLLQDYDNLAHLDAPARVFDPNPVATLGDHRLLVTAGKKKHPKLPPPDAYRDVTLTGLRKPGYLQGPYVKINWRVKRNKNEFCFKSNQRGFKDVMAYYHIDTVVRYLEELGFRVRALFRKPLEVNAYGSPKDNSWYSSGLWLLTFGYGGVDDAEDGEMILHEFGHALQDAICPDFGQSREAAAMGEGFGDYLAASFFAHKKVAEYRTSLMSWDAIASDKHNPPRVRRVDEDRTYRRFRDRANYEHTNGQIWSATLWDIWETLGREKADTLIIESHFQLDAFTTFDRGARAILDADQNLYGGRYRRRLLHIFRDRRIGPLTRRH